MDLTIMLTKRTALKTSFDEEVAAVNKLTKKQRGPSDDELAEISARLDEMRVTYETCLDLCEKIEILSAKEDNYAEEISTAKKLRTEQRVALQKIETYLDSNKPKKTDTKTEEKSIKKTAQLPKIRLPTFDGTPTKWAAFWQTMEADVMKGDYCDITKFNYISGQLRGTAADAMVGIHASGENLQTIITILKDRFGQPRKVIRAHVNELLDISPPANNYTSLNQFLFTVKGHIRSLENLNVNSFECSALLVPILERKIPKPILDRMGTCDQTDKFNIEKFMRAFTEELDNMGERGISEKVGHHQHHNSPNPRQKHGSSAGLMAYTRDSNCLICGAGNHRAKDCPLTPAERGKKVSELRKCFNCLGNHRKSDCRSTKTCWECKRRHHTSLHAYFQSLDKSDQNKNKHNMLTVTDRHVPIVLLGDGQSSKSAPVKPEVLPTCPDGVVLLETARVTVSNENCSKQLQNIGLLLDRGSHDTYVRRDIVNRLQLNVIGKKLREVHGFAGHVTDAKWYDIVQLKIRTKNEWTSIEVLVLDRISSNINQDGWKEATKLPHIANLELADTFENELSVDILLGQDVAYKFLEGQISCEATPIVQHSKLGCIISGPLKPQIRNVFNAFTDTSDSIIYDNRIITDRDNADYAEFERNNVFHVPNENEREYETFLNDYAAKIDFKDGRYSVPLPWKPEHPELKNNIELCRSRLNQVIKRLQRLNLMTQYCAVMAENIGKGYISESGKTIEESKFDTHFIPHFPVLRESDTTPVRIVMDASSGEPSLNSCLIEGPNLISDLCELLHLFRSRKVGLVADIARAFLSISLREEDRKYVQFLWFKDNDVTKEIVPYFAQTIIFGNVSSPFCLGITLKKHLDSYVECAVAKDLAGKLYVDNLVTSVDSSTDAEAYYRKTINIMRDGAFVMRQWASNDQGINEHFREDQNGINSDTVSLLGLKWDTETDSIQLANKNVEAGDYEVTQRSVLSKTSTIYDPLGLVGPMGSKAKSFVQKLRIENREWDDKLTQEEISEWTQISQDLSRTHEFKIPRWLGFDRSKPMTLVVFCDASPKTALGCVAYAKQDGIVRLIGSKNRVVSQKTPNNNTVPKLELQAMAIGAAYGNSLKNIYSKEYSSVNIVYLTDSEIALYWLQSDKKLKQFVRNRVESIKQLSDLSTWYHVTTEENSADILSRGATFSQLQQSTWFDGPDWLKQDMSAWPISRIGDKPVTHVCLFTASTEVNDVYLADVKNVLKINDFNDFNKLIRRTALLKKAFSSQSNSAITAADLNKATELWIRSAQREYYSDVIDSLSGKTTKKPAIVHHLGLELDEQGLIRCAGRLTYADISQNQKRPYLIPPFSRLAELLIRKQHENVFHYGVGMTIVKIRKKYWIPQIRSIVKKILKKCVICKKVQGKNYIPPQEPPLPDFRLSYEEPFNATAIDFTGHVTVWNGESQVKRYIALFCCCATRAIHLEVIKDMSVESYLQAFRRFCATQSTPKLIYTDNAKTFISGESEIKKLLTIACDTKAQKLYADRMIKFIYPPAKAPWFSGLHERCISTVKSALKKSLGKKTISEEEFVTLLKEIQCEVNNRPMTYINEDIRDLEPLSPNKLIYGRDLHIIPNEAVTDDTDMDFELTDNKFRKLARRRAQLLEIFKRRFHDEYLSTLREQHAYRKGKHHKPTPVKVGEVVLINEKDEKRRNWKLGIIIETHPSKDNLIRSVTVKTKNGTTRRPIAKLAPLGILADFDDTKLRKNKVVGKAREIPIRQSTREAARKARENIRKYTRDDSEDGEYSDDE